MADQVVGPPYSDVISMVTQRENPQGILTRCQVEVDSRDVFLLKKEWAVQIYVHVRP